jgi:hypothetical protein
MRRSTAVAVVAAALLAAPHQVSAKGFAAASVCGPDDCRPLARAAARAGFEDVARARTPARAEAFLTIHLRARVSSGRVAEVYRLHWLPDAGVMRGYREREWTRPGPALDRALRRAARGLRSHPASELPSLCGAQARVDEVFAPARKRDPGPPIVAAAALAGLLAAFAIGRGHKRPAPSPR